VRLHDPGLGRFGVDDESGLLPEVAHQGPELLGRHRGAEPALLAGALDAHRAGFGLRRPGGYRVALGGLDLATAALVAGVGRLGGKIGNLVPIGAARRSEVRRDIEALGALLLAGRLVVDLAAFLEFPAERAGTDAGRDNEQQAQ